MADGTAGEWVPEFEGQRPPFASGNTLAASTHGAYSPRKVTPLAQELVDQVLGDTTAPSHAKAPAFRAELWAWARAEAQTQLLTEWLTKAGDAAGDGVGDLRSESVRSAYLLLHRAESRAASARTRLGLTPIAAARLGKDVAQGHAAEVDVAQRMAMLADAEATAKAKARAELEADGWQPPAEIQEPPAADEPSEVRPAADTHAQEEGDACP